MPKQALEVTPEWLCPYEDCRGVIIPKGTALGHVLAVWTGHGRPKRDPDR